MCMPGLDGAEPSSVDRRVFVRGYQSILCQEHGRTQLGVHQSGTSKDKNQIVGFFELFLGEPIFRRLLPIRSFLCAVGHANSAFLAPTTL